MQVRQLWRFPVKSLQGEQVRSAVLTAQGIEGDRRHAIFDLDTGFGLTARRVPELLFASAAAEPDGGVRITLPDGTVAADDAALSNWLGRRVTLRSAAEDGARRYENPEDFEHENTSRWEPFDGSPGAFHDSGRTAVSLLSQGTLGAWPVRRFRANVLVDGSNEDALVGSQVRLGDAALDVGKRIERCVMVTRPQPDGVERDLDVLRTIHQDYDGCLAVGAVVTRAGTVSVGDTLAVT
ncbi:MAG: MOSC N-terminal beta barrel domain-containing protein [bacterium]